jgi:hypothetical protein
LREGASANRGDVGGDELRSATSPVARSVRAKSASPRLIQYLRLVSGPLEPIAVPAQLASAPAL